MQRTFDAFAADYDRFTGLRPGVSADWVRGLGLSGERALDAGCGAGRQTVTLAESFHEVVGVDISAPMIELARARRSVANVAYEVADLATFADPDGFDLVFSSTALHHVDDLRGALGNLARLTRPGGTVVCVDCLDSVWLRISPRAVYATGALLDLPRDLRRFGPRDALWLLRYRLGPWLAHLLTDRYLSRSEFERRYSEALPGARFEYFGFGACIWRKPAGGTNRT